MPSLEKAAIEKAAVRTGSSRAGRPLLTLTEVSRRTGISMPTLQRYKKLYQDRIPSKGMGRRQRYPREALAIFEEIKTENLARRGRPKKPRPEGSGLARDSRPASDLLTLSEIGRRTGISYPTLLRYVRLHLREIPHEGAGRSRRFHPGAVEVFRRLRAQSRRGRKPKAATVAERELSRSVHQALADRIERLETAQATLTQELRRVLEALQAPSPFVSG